VGRLRGLNVVNTKNVVNPIKQEFSPAILKDTGPVVPKPNFFAKTTPDEQLGHLDRQVASSAFRTFRHDLRHGTSFSTSKILHCGGPVTTEQMQADSSSLKTKKKPPDAVDMQGTAGGLKGDPGGSLRGVSGVDLVNVIEQELAPALFNDAGALVPEADFSPKTVHDERFEVLDRHMASGALRAFRHYLCHETSLRTLIGC
jgi:hypothetical protein